MGKNKKNKKTKQRNKKQPPKKGSPKKQETLDFGLLQDLVAHTSERCLEPEEREQLAAALSTLLFLTQELQAKGITISKLRKMLFGSQSEKTSKVLGQLENSSGSKDEPSPPSETSAPLKQEKKEEATATQKTPPKGHGRNGADAYVGAQRLPVPHESLQPKDGCPCCEGGKVYEKEPAVQVRVLGMGPLQATVYEKQRLRCHLCGQVFTAKSPEGVGDEKYDESAKAMIGLLKYGCGLPFHRLEKLGQNLRIPLPSSTQWDLVEQAADSLEVIWEELVRQAACGEVAYIDDTKAKILNLHEELQKALAEGTKTRTGIFTSGIVSTVENGPDIVLFYTGNEHAGENLAKVVEQRPEELPPIIQMSDALACNTSEEFESIVSFCLVHARRNFVEVAENFPKEVEVVLTELKEVYKHDAEAKEQGLTAAQRLLYHQEKSQPVMERLEKWLNAQFEDKNIEPNSSLGSAIEYMQNHWHELTQFLRVEGAPLDSNLVERMLKKVILHRKNSLFFKTQKGARVGDLWMSVIFTTERCQEGVFEYLVAVQKYHHLVKENPPDWLPWNYRQTMERLKLPAP